MSKYSRDKGKRGERGYRDDLRAAGFLKAERGQQFCGGTDSPDIKCPELARYHFEVKFVEKLNIYSAYDQARRDSGTKTPIVAHRKSRSPWLITMESQEFYHLLRGGITAAQAQALTRAIAAHHNNEALCPTCEESFSIVSGLYPNT